MFPDRHGPVSHATVPHPHCKGACSIDEVLVNVSSWSACGTHASMWERCSLGFGEYEHVSHELLQWCLGGHCVVHEGSLELLVVGVADDRGREGVVAD